MHTVAAYRELIDKVMSQAERLVACLAESQRSHGLEVINFLKKYGCRGFPGQEAGDYSFGWWLGHSGSPASQDEAVAIVPYFSDDVLPFPLPPDAVRPGRFLSAHQTILLFNVDQWSIVELALTLLHEARHARHRLGSKLGGLSPLDADCDHEPTTWVFILGVLIAWGGKAWDHIVQQELAWIRTHEPWLTPPGQLFFAKSHHYWPELDLLLGGSSHPMVRVVRQYFVSMHANMLYWTRLRPSLNYYQVIHALVSG